MIMDTWFRFTGWCRWRLTRLTPGIWLRSRGWRQRQANSEVNTYCGHVRLDRAPGPCPVCGLVRHEDLRWRAFFNNEIKAFLYRMRHKG